MGEITNGKNVLVYVRPAGRDTDGKYEYDLYFSKTPEYVWGPEWDVDSPISNGDITPDATTYDEIMRIATSLPLKTAEETGCMSMEYATYGILALSWIDIENLDEYPEHGRMVFHFGDDKEFIMEKLSEYGWSTENREQ